MSDVPTIEEIGLYTLPSSTNTVWRRGTVVILSDGSAYKFRRRLSDKTARRRVQEVIDREYGV